METKNKTTDSILMILLKEPFVTHTATSLSKSLNITRQGLWKSLNKLKENNLIVLESISNTHKSTITIKIQWSNPLTPKTLSLLLTKESIKHERWTTSLAELEKLSNFTILYGSILHSPKEAKDIDILTILPKNNFQSIDKKVLEIQKTQAKKIHLIDLTKNEFSKELNNKNKAYLDALKKGVVLFGQDDYVRFIEKIIR
ncbi:MAG: HTH domain-containing protein [Nanoarchaeota archaeon]|nr:HTH domain-containing protein [Nanoarchaeota archaeon]